MRKIPTLFVRGADWLATDELMPGCQWVMDGEGIATEKLDGTNVMVVFHQDGRYTIHKRRNPSKENKKLDFQPTNIPIDPDNKGDRWATEAVSNFLTDNPNHGLYGPVYGEIIGPKINKNHYGLDKHTWVPFLPPWITKLHNLLRDFNAIQTYLKNFESRAYPGHPGEGIVFHGLFGQAAKIKVKDFWRK